MPAQHNPQPGQRGPQRSSGPGQDFSYIRFGKPLDPELFNEQVLKVVNIISDSGPKRNKVTQLRRFYDELVLWEGRVRQQPDQFDQYLPFIRMLNAKATYAKERKLVSRDFVDLLAHTLKITEDAETFTICKLFWEAFMGFFYKQEPGDN